MLLFLLFNVVNNKLKIHTETELTAFMSFLLSKFFTTLFTAVMRRFDLFLISRIHIPELKHFKRIGLFSLKYKRKIQVR